MDGFLQIPSEGMRIDEASLPFHCTIVVVVAYQKFYKWNESKMKKMKHEIQCPIFTGKFNRILCPCLTRLALILVFHFGIYATGCWGTSLTDYPTLCRSIFFWFLWLYFCSLLSCWSQVEGISIFSWFTKYSIFNFWNEKQFGGIIFVMQSYFVDGSTYIFCFSFGGVLIG